MIVWDLWFIIITFVLRLRFQSRVAIDDNSQAAMHYLLQWTLSYPALSYPALNYLEYSAIQSRSQHILFNAHAAYRAK